MTSHTSFKVLTGIDKTNRAFLAHALVLLLPRCPTSKERAEVLFGAE